VQQGLLAPSVCAGFVDQNGPSTEQRVKDLVDQDGIVPATSVGSYPTLAYEGELRNWTRSDRCPINDAVGIEAHTDGTAGKGEKNDNA